MSDLGRFLAEASNSPFASFLFGLVAKATMLLALAAIAAALLRRSSAAVRHRVWCLAFAALLLLPGLSPLLPEWRLAVLPYSSPLAPREVSRPRAPQAIESQSVMRRSLKQRPTANEPFGIPRTERDDDFALKRRVDEPILRQPAPDTAAAVRPLSRIAALWTIGALVFLMPLALGVLRTVRLRRHARPIEGADWSALLGELRDRLGLNRPVALYEADAALMPMTWGVRRPVVLLPLSARDWPDRPRRIVLLHELAHVKRCDVAAQMLGRVACALYWFHPLAWYALRRLRIERELACDDCVVLAGERATDYAAELLQIARSYRPVYFAAAVAMAQPSNLEHRLRAMFDRACSHLPISPRAARLLLAGVLVFVTAIAAVRLSPRASQANDGDNSGGKSKDGAPTSTYHIAIRVLDSANKPIAGARVRVLRVDAPQTSWSEAGQVVAEGRSDDAGRATLDYDGSGPFATREQFVSSGIVIVADADGYAFDWLRPSSANDTRTVTLPRDDAPIEGRVLDLEGRPRSGVHVGVVQVAGSAENVAAWVEAATGNPVSLDEGQFAKPIRSRETDEPPLVARFPGKDNVQFGDRGLIASALTDENGRFRMTGLGRDRLVMLELSGGGIAKTWLNVVTRDMPAVPYPEYDPRFRVPTCFGRRFDFTAEPEQPISGLVRDAESGAALAGVEIRLGQYADGLLDVEGFLSAISDAQGRYVLHGVPKPHDAKRSHRLRVVPGADQPYFRTETQVARRDGFDPVTCDITLKRALWLRGRVTDADTGKPLRGLVEYYPFLTNDAAKDYPNFDPGVRSFEGDRYSTDDDGVYRLPALAGRGLVAFMAKDRDRYPEGDGAGAIAGLKGADELNVYHLESIFCATALRELNLSADAAEAIYDIQVRPLKVADIELVDSTGQPIAGVVTMRLTPLRFGPFNNGWSYEPLPTATVRVYGPSEPRTVMFLHRERKLAAAISLPSSAKLPKQVALHPCASISGRIVDRDGTPLPKLNFELNAAAAPATKGGQGAIAQASESDHQLNRLPTDQNGRFHVDFVPPGVAYVVWARLDGQKLEVTTPVVQPGQSLDLGDVALGPGKTTDVEKQSAVRKQSGQGQAAGAEPAPLTTDEKQDEHDQQRDDATQQNSEAEAVTLRGRVLLPDGKPAAGAEIHWLQMKVGDAKSRPELWWEKRATTDGDGRFQWKLENTDAKIGAENRPPLIAYKPGLGLDGFTVGRDEAKTELSLRLTESCPIRGRLTDTEGRPVKDAKIVVQNIEATEEGPLDRLLEKWKRNPQLARGQPGRILPLYKGFAPLAAETDGEGRFIVSAVGRERVALLAIAGQGYMSDELRVVTRDGFDADEYNKSMTANAGPFMRAPGRLPRFSGPVFDSIMEAELIIRGTVFTGPNRKPVADARVGAGGARNLSGMPTTDAAGHFEVRGVRRSQNVGLLVFPPGDLLSRSVRLDIAPGQTVIDVDVEVKEGIAVEGRIFDRVTGAGVHGNVSYVPLADNRFVDQPGYDDNIRGFLMTNADGHFRRLVPPGPGVLMAQVHPNRPGSQSEPRRYRQAAFSEADSNRVPTTVRDDDRFFTISGNVIIFLSDFGAVKIIEPAPDSGPLKCDLPLDPGKTATIAIEDGQGQPVVGAWVAGVADLWPITFKIDESTCAIYGLGADRPRRVCILHPERHLAGAITLTGEEREKATVRLVATASIDGRALDADGEPLADAAVQINYPRRTASELLRFVNMSQVPLTTGGDGRFHVENIVPGETFSLDFKQGETFFRAPVIPVVWEKGTLSAGQKLELGDMKVKQLR